MWHKSHSTQKNRKTNNIPMKGYFKNNLSCSAIKQSELEKWKYWTEFKFDDWNLLQKDLKHSTSEQICISQEKEVLGSIMYWKVKEISLSKK